MNKKNKKTIINRGPRVTANETQNIIDNIVWSDRHEVINKKYKLVELKKILKDNNKLIGGSKKQLVDRVIKCKLISE